MYHIVRKNLPLEWLRELRTDGVGSGRVVVGSEVANPAGSYRSRLVLKCLRVAVDVVDGDGFITLCEPPGDPTGESVWLALSVVGRYVDSKFPIDVVAINPRKHVNLKGVPEVLDALFGILVIDGPYGSDGWGKKNEDSGDDFEAHRSRELGLSLKRWRYSCGVGESKLIFLDSDNVCPLSLYVSCLKVESKENVSHGDVFSSLNEGP